MHVDEVALLEKLVDRIRQAAAHPEHAAEQVGAWTQVGNGPQKLRGVAFLLQRIGLVGMAVHRDLRCLHLPLLSPALRLDQLPLYPHRGAGVQRLDVGGVIVEIGVGDDLQALETGAVIQLDEGETLAVAPRPHPTLHQHLVGRFG